MKITKTQNGSSLTIALEGRLDTTTSPELEKELQSSLNGIEDLEFDLSSLEYISSAGLRVLLTALKVMNKQGSMVVRHASPELMDIFEVTGFVDLLNIE